MQHAMMQIKSPVNVTVRCSCGWSRQITRFQNALARAAKVRAAYSEHEKRVGNRENSHGSSEN